MKISERVVRFLLIFLIALSLFFSYNIWLSPTNNKSTSVDSDNVVTDTKNYRKDTDSFLPLRLVITEDKTAKGTQSENIISQVQTFLSEDVSDNLQVVVDGNEKTFNSYKTISDGFELLYEGKFLLSDYFDIYQIDVSNQKKAEDFYFTRIQVDFDTKKVNFVDYDNKRICQLSFTGLANTYKNIIKEKDVAFTNMTSEGVVNEKQYNTSEAVSLKKYSYILSTQAFTLFRNAFFQNPTDVNSDNVSVYTSGQERLEIDADQQLAEFRGELAATDDLKDIYLQSFSYVKKLGTSVGNLKYFDRSSNQVDYRVFVEGYPVFGDYSRGLVSVIVNGKQSESKNISIVTSTNTIQVPIPADEVVDLPSTDTVQKQILEAGAKQDSIKSILIGYTWQNIKETNRVVDLTPEWYIKYGDTWYSESELIKKLPELEAG